MSAENCLVCMRNLRSVQRETVVRQLSLRIADKHRYPPIFRLIHQLSLCIVCLQQLPFIEGHVCRRCGRPLKIAGSDVCGDCKMISDDLLQKNCSLLSYNDWGKELISRFKYRGDERFATLFADLLTIGFHRYYHAHFITIGTHVPLHESRLRERGFNQAELLASLMGKSVGLDVVPMLVRIKQTVQLSKQSGRKSRQESMREAFSLNEQLHLDVLIHAKTQPPTILLIDDIFTTGATLRSCAKTIGSRYRDAMIYSLTIFR